MDGNTTRINRILRRSIRLPTPTRSHHPIHNRLAHNSNQVRSRRQRILRQAIIRMGQRSHFRRATSSL